MSIDVVPGMVTALKMFADAVERAQNPSTEESEALDRFNRAIADLNCRVQIACR